MYPKLAILALLAMLTACAAPLEVSSGHGGAEAPDLRALIEVTR